MRSIRKSVELFALLAACSACSTSVPAPIPTANPQLEEPRRGGEFTFATLGDVRSLDPANVAEGLSPIVLENVLAGLVDYDHDGKIVPDLAERWVIEDDGKTFRFFLREGVRFHDGEDLTAEDVKRSVVRALHGSAPNPYASYFTAIEGADALNAQKSTELPGVVVEGKYVVTFKLTKPDAIFLPLLAMPMLRPVCKSAGDRYKDSWALCGAGPFKLAKWEHGREVRLARFDGYHKKGLPYLDGVRMLVRVTPNTQWYKFGRGELDVTRDLRSGELARLLADPRWKGLGEYDTEKQIGGDAMNVEMPPFDNIEIRRAISKAIDRRETALIKATNMVPLDQPIPSALVGHDPNLAGRQTFDRAAALEHMRRAGYPFDPATGKGGYPHVIPYLVYKQGITEYGAQVLAQQLAKIGIRIELRVVNYGTLMALRARRHASAFGPGLWTQDFPDAISFLEPLFHSRSINDEESNNWSFYKNPRVDELIDKARMTMDEGERKRIYQETSTIICEDAPWAFTYSYRWHATRQPYVRAWRSHPIYVHELSRTWLDRATGPLAASRILSRDALAAVFGERSAIGAERRP